MCKIIQRILVGSIVILLVVPLFAQQKKAAVTSAARGAVSGHIFAITKSGDLKPARMAKVYLLWDHPSLQFVQGQEKKGIHEDSATLIFLQAHNKAMEEAIAQRQRDYDANRHHSDSLDCREDLREYETAVLAARQWCLDNRKLEQVLSTDADEEGYFKIANVRPGVYSLVARGQAGFNDAVWLVGATSLEDMTDIVVPPGKEVVLKLASPEKACLTIDSEN